MANSRISVVLPEVLSNRLQAFSDCHNLSRSQVIKQMLSLGFLRSNWIEQHDLVDSGTDLEDLLR